MDPVLDQIRKVCSIGSRYFCKDAEDTLMFEITEEAFEHLKTISSKDEVFWVSLSGNGPYDKEWRRIRLQVRIKTDKVWQAQAEYSAMELKIIAGLGLTPDQLFLGSRSKP